MDYVQAQHYMDEVGKRGSILGLDAVKKLLERLDCPQDKLNVIHVAGTNGKGSICTFLEAMYRAEGKRVGRYISPTIHTYLERFQLNGEYMCEAEFAQILSEIKPVIDRMEAEKLATPTAFEIETAVAFCFFVRKKADIVILETGMGGRLDATNVVTAPLCTVFASIGRDHMQFLGDTVEQIAHEKAGIMRDHCPVIGYPNDAAVCDVLSLEAELHGVTPEFVKKEDIVIRSESLQGSRFCYKGQEYTISLAGTYQIYNAATAIACKLRLDGTLQKEALAKVSWEGRFEKISESPLFIKDGAHNTDGANALLASIQKHFTNKRILFIIGVLADKEYQKMMQLLCPVAQKVFTITPDNSRALSAGELAEAVMPYCRDVRACESIPDAISRALAAYREYEKQGEEAVIIAWGSLSYIGQIDSVE